MLKRITPYITFTDGKCAEALEFYKKVLKAEVMIDKKGQVELMHFAGSPMETPENKHLIMHGHIKIGASEIMVSDTTQSDQIKVGTNLTLCLDNFKSKTEMDVVFTELSAGGMVIMPLEKQFWNAYFGLLMDKFGIQWMFHMEL